IQRSTKLTVGHRTDCQRGLFLLPNRQVLPALWRSTTGHWKNVQCLGRRTTEASIDPVFVGECRQQRAASVCTFRMASAQFLHLDGKPDNVFGEWAAHHEKK